MTIKEIINELNIKYKFLNIDIEMFQAMLFEKCYGINDSEFYADIGIDYDDEDYEDLDYPF